MKNIAFCSNSFIQTSFLSFFIPVGQFRGYDKRSAHVSCTSLAVTCTAAITNGVFVMREGRQLIPQSILCGRVLFTRVVSKYQVFPHCSVTFGWVGWVILLLVSSYLLCYNSACPAFTQFFSILHFLCSRDTNIISPFILPLLHFRVDCSLPKDPSPHLTEVFFIAPY